MYHIKCEDNEVTEYITSTVHNGRDTFTLDADRDKALRFEKVVAEWFISVFQHLASQTLELVDVQKLYDIGEVVEFLPEMYEDNNAEYYLKYKGHTFTVDHYMVDDLESGEKQTVYDHIALKCVDDPDVIVEGYVHAWDMKLAP